MRAAVRAFIGIGANLGDAVATVSAAIDDLGRLAGSQLVRASSLYRSAPVEAAGPDYANAVVALDTYLTAPGLMKALQGLEHAAGRARPWPNAPRTLDLDLLLYGDARIDSEHLTVPHPRLQARAFVLLPLSEIAPQRVEPGWLAAVASQTIAPIQNQSTRPD